MVYQIKCRLEVDETCIKWTSNCFTFIDNPVQYEYVIDRACIWFEAILKWVVGPKTFLSKLQTIVQNTIENFANRRGNSNFKIIVQ